MKLFILSDLFATADRWHRALLWCAECVQDVRVWAWSRATRENLRTCNERVACRDVLS